MLGLELGSAASELVGRAKAAVRADGYTLAREVRDALLTPDTPDTVLAALTAVIGRRHAVRMTAGEHDSQDWRAMEDAAEAAGHGVAKGWMTWHSFEASQRDPNPLTLEVLMVAAGVVRLGGKDVQPVSVESTA